MNNNHAFIRYRALDACLRNRRRRYYFDDLMEVVNKVLYFREDQPRPDRRVIIFSTDNGEDHLIYTLTIFINGKAGIDVRARNREGIGFSGEVDLGY